MISANTNTPFPASHLDCVNESGPGIAYGLRNHCMAFMFRGTAVGVSEYFIPGSDSTHPIVVASIDSVNFIPVDIPRTKGLTERISVPAIAGRNPQDLTEREQVFYACRAKKDSASLQLEPTAKPFFTWNAGGSYQFHHKNPTCFYFINSLIQGTLEMTTQLHQIFDSDKRIFFADFRRESKTHIYVELVMVVPAADMETTMIAVNQELLRIAKPK